MRDAPAAIKSAKRIVIKIGSALITDDQSGTVRKAWLAALAEDIAALHKEKKEIVLVTSGAIALGRKAMNVAWTDRPASIPLDIKQACASVGQVHLSGAYDAALSVHGIATSIVLLTPRDTEDRQSHLNARATLSALLSRGVIPVINENDTVATVEIRFGDNDRLAARVAQMVGADLLIQLSTTDGLYTADPRVDSSARHIPVVETLSDDVRAMAGDALAGLSTGGMKSKIIAADIATLAGVPMIIAKGTEAHPLRDLMNGARATLFLSHGTPMSARKRWIQAHVKTQGTLTIDDGAATALRAGKSLLPAGVVSMTGDFDRGDAVTILDPKGQKIAVGLIAYPHADAVRLIGHKSSEMADILGYAGREELIHRDDLALLS